MIKSFVRLGQFLIYKRADIDNSHQWIFFGQPSSGQMICAETVGSFGTYNKTARFALDLISCEQRRNYGGGGFRCRIPPQ